MADLWFEDLKREILAERPVCEVCGIRYATELNHCIVHDQKRIHRQLTCRENLQATCSICHTSTEQKAHSREEREKFVEKQIERGYDIGKWYRSLDLRVKEAWLLKL